jgi:two-component system sensor histidine kinase KdpD
MAFAEPGQIERVVTNLVENSAKYSQPGSSISVKVRAEPNTLIVSVTDRGPGIPSEEAERVFEKFVRLNAADAPAPPGTGLGLPLCKTIVEAHGGRIWYEPRRGGGARFSFTLPRSDPDA